MTLRGDAGQVMRLKVSGLPKGERIDLSALMDFARRAYRERAPWQTQRGEEAPLTVESGLEDGVIMGDVTFALESPKSTRNLKLTGIPLPGTVDYVEFAQYGRRLPRPDADAERKLFCAAGGLLVQLLAARGVFIGAHLSCVGLVRDRLFDPLRVDAAELEGLRSLAFPVLDENRGMQMIQRILREKAACNSVGAQIECAILGLPRGLGGTWFSALQGRLASGAMAVPDVNGVEFGPGFASASLRGSQTTDAIVAGENGPELSGNHSGGLLGGKTTGLPLIFRVSVQSAPVISGEVDSVDWAKNERVVLMGRVEEEQRPRGRHEKPFEGTEEAAARDGRHAQAEESLWEDRDEYVDLRTGNTVRLIEAGEPESPCPALAVLPCVEAMAACILWDEWVKEESSHGKF